MDSPQTYRRFKMPVKQIEMEELNLVVASDDELEEIAMMEVRISCGTWGGYTSTSGC